VVAEPVAQPILNPEPICQPDDAMPGEWRDAEGKLLV